MGAWVYLMTNRPNGTLYTGCTVDLPRRIWEHRDGVAEGFTKQYGLKRLVYAEWHDELLRANDDGSVDLRVRVVCSAGTYIRTLAEDLGQKLGLGSHLAELRRTRAGPFQIDEALTFERLAEVCKLEMLDDALVSPYYALSHLPVIELDADQARRIRDRDENDLPGLQRSEHQVQGSVVGRLAFE